MPAQIQWVIKQNVIKEVDVEHDSDESEPSQRSYKHLSEVF